MWFKYKLWSFLQFGGRGDLSVTLKQNTFRTENDGNRKEGGLLKCLTLAKKTEAWGLKVYTPAAGLDGVDRLLLPWGRRSSSYPGFGEEKWKFSRNCIGCREGGGERWRGQWEDRYLVPKEETVWLLVDCGQWSERWCQSKTHWHLVGSFLDVLAGFQPPFRSVSSLLLAAAHS